jgi:hypothetical protein
VSTEFSGLSPLVVEEVVDEVERIVIIADAGWNGRLP